MSSSSNTAHTMQNGRDIVKQRPSSEYVNSDQQRDTGRHRETQRETAGQEFHQEKVLTKAIFGASGPPSGPSAPLARSNFSERLRYRAPTSTSQSVAGW